MKEITVKLLLLAVLVPHQALYANHVKCTCPNVNARATGSTSCSASESDGRCTVAFNEFDLPLENAALQLLRKSSQAYDIDLYNFPAEVGSEQLRGFTQKAAQWLWRQNKIAVPDQILIYALVTVVQNPDSAKNTDIIAEVHAGLRDSAETISNIFVNGGGEFDNGLLRVSHGCLEFKAERLWGMYKASWSDDIGKDQCSR